MLIWRISDFAALDGKGGLFSGGRWHRQGRQVVYTAESSALALLEALVRRERGVTLPPPFQLLRIELPDDLSALHWPAAATPTDQRVSAQWGDDWLARGETALARVPAAVAPHSFNWLINPLHPDATRIGIAEARHWPWDERFFR